MNLSEFKRLCAVEFSFLSEHGFAREEQSFESPYVIYDRQGMVVEFKWEDFGYFITASAIREDLDADRNWISINSLIKVTAPPFYRPDARGPAEIFGHAALIRYYAMGLRQGLISFLRDQETIWRQCRLADEEQAAGELFLSDE